MDRKQSDIPSEEDSNVIEFPEANGGQSCEGSPTATETEDKADDLNHSRPLDVHVWSDHPEVNAFVDTIYGKLYSAGNKRIRKKHLKVVLLDLYVAWHHDPDLKIAVSFNNNSYKPQSRYNELHITRRTIGVVRDLESAGLIERASGYRDPATGVGRISRIWPTESLISHFKDAQFSLFDIGDHPDRETVILKNDEGEEIEYADSEMTNSMRAVLEAYNNLLKNTYIDIPSLSEPFIDHGKDKRGKTARLHISQNAKFVRRIFNRGSFDKGGRFYGGWWQNCPKEWRKKIYINDEPTVEIDFSGFHIVLLYAQEGISYPESGDDDPYLVEPPLPFLKDERQARHCAKLLLLMALNAKDERRAFKAFRDKCEAGSEEKRFTDDQLSELLNRLKEKHQPIKQYIASDAGINLMNLDAQISEHIIKKCTTLNIPVLAIHDSFIVPLSKEDQLTQLMYEALDKATSKLLQSPMNKIQCLSVKYPRETDRTTRYIRQYEKFKSWVRERQEIQREDEYL